MEQTRTGTIKACSPKTGGILLEESPMNWLNPQDDKKDAFLKMIQEGKIGKGMEVELTSSMQGVNFFSFCKPLSAPQTPQGQPQRGFNNYSGNRNFPYRKAPFYQKPVEAEPRPLDKFIPQEFEATNLKELCIALRTFCKNEYVKSCPIYPPVEPKGMWTAVAWYKLVPKEEQPEEFEKM